MSGDHDPDRCVTLREYFEALDRADARWQEERDRRYAEVRAAEVKAADAREAADDRAVQLAREIVAASRTERRLDVGQLIAIVAVIIAAISVAAFLLKK